MRGVYVYLESEHSLHAQIRKMSLVHGQNLGTKCGARNVEQILAEFLCAQAHMGVCVCVFKNHRTTKTHPARLARTAYFRLSSCPRPKPPELRGPQ